MTLDKGLKTANKQTKQHEKQLKIPRMMQVNEKYNDDDDDDDDLVECECIQKLHSYVKLGEVQPGKLSRNPIKNVKNTHMSRSGMCSIRA
jgi:hypothetical protein